MKLLNTWKIWKKALPIITIIAVQTRMWKRNKATIVPSLNSITVKPIKWVSYISVVPDTKVKCIHPKVSPKVTPKEIKQPTANKKCPTQRILPRGIMNF